MARTAYNDPQAESIYQHGAGNARMPDALSNAKPNLQNPDNGSVPTGHDQKMTKKNKFAPK